MGYENSLRKTEAVHWFTGSSVHRSKAMGALGPLGALGALSEARVS